MLVQSSPKVAPIMHVAAATYGLTPTARRDRLEAISRELRKVAYIEHRIREGMVVLVSSHECYLSRLLFMTAISSCVWVYVWVSLCLCVGLVIQPDEVMLFKSKGRLLHLRDVFRALPTAFVDVSAKLQQMADDGALCMHACL